MDVTAVLGLLRRRWLPLALCVLVAAAAAVWHNHTSPRIYQSKARLFVNLPAAQTTQEALQGVQLSSNLIKSYAQIATSRTTAQRVKDRLGLPDSPGAIQGALTAAPEPQTLIITIAATDRDPARARSIAQAAAVVLNDSIAALERDRDKKAAVQAAIVDNATTPVTPISPRPARNLVLGVILGALAGVALALLLDALDRTVKGTADAERLLHAPGLAVVPRAREVEKHAVVTADAALSPASEAFRTLRTGVRFVEPDEPLRSLVVTSPSTGEGKTTTAVNLAVALAQSGEQVILVDADLRRPAVAKTLGIEGAVGLSNVIMRSVDLDDALQSYRGLFHVLPAGTTPPNPSEILGSQRMAALVEELTSLADIVVFDAPPVLPVTDAAVLSAQTDAAIVVVRHGRTGRTMAAEAAKRLAAVDALVAGFVLNGVPRSQSDGYYESYRRALAAPAQASGA